MLNAALSKRVGKRAKGEQLLEITLLEDCCDLDYYEIVEESSGYREWCLPAEILNRFGKIRLLSPEEELEISDPRFDPSLGTP